MPETELTDTEPTELDVRQVRKPDKHPAIFARFDALAVGESFVLVNNHYPWHLRDELLDLVRQRALGEHPRAELVERLMDVGGQFASSRTDVMRCGGIDGIGCSSCCCDDGCREHGLSVPLYRPRCRDLPFVAVLPGRCRRQVGLPRWS